VRSGRDLSNNRAERNLRRVPAAERARILSAIGEMRLDTLKGDVVKLKGRERSAVGSAVIGLFSITFQHWPLAS
jgi:hypothetical protein